ncbi:alpha/beta fold hydrolase [Tsukamurella paurometabola]|uniref:alpha/beta fold hydrolase n=1 Tax=Tsukamurella paurometabola TaxID=2061 RepID=UPI00019F0114|nr:alpha/beta hydrolase [Tsukamurella paurometabola]
MTVIAVALSATGLYLLRDPSPVGYWRSASAREAYLTDYRQAFGDLPPAAETRDVRTSYGFVRVYRFGESRPGTDPIVLVPGRASGVPMWSQNLPGLLAGHMVYAIDALGDAGMSAQIGPIRDGEDQATWLNETFDGLGLTRVNLIGHSFGGWTAANYATRHPDRVATLSLWEPILVFAGLRWQMYLATLPSSIPFLPKSWRQKGLAVIGGAQGSESTEDSPLGRMIDAATEGFRAKLPTPMQLTSDDLARLTMPTFVGLGAKSSVTDADAAARTAEKLPASTVRIWPEGTHSLPMQYPSELNQEVQQLFQRAKS